MLRKVCNAVVAVGLTATAGCVGSIDGNEELGSNGASISWEEFRDSTYREPGPNGLFIVDGDTPIDGEKNLREFYDALFPQDGALIVHTVGGSDAAWTATQKLNISYCVSDTFGSNKSKVVTAMAQATGAWQGAANVAYVYKPEQDASCTASNGNVVFDVRPVSGQSYVARAFFPDSSRSSRNVLIDSSAFGNLSPWTLKGILTHELGHTLGFRHEHTRPEAGTCFEDNSWRPLTPYDSSSVMHYPQCNGTQNGDLVITAKDAQGAASLYGAPGGGNPDPQPNPDPTQSKTDSGSVAKNANVQLGAVSVKPGSVFTAVMTGSGDPDLYVRFGAQPTTSSYNCRPYLDGANETCTLTVPAGATTAYVMVRGYTAATYTVTRTWTAP